jgi:hypothetical protein
MEVGAERVFPNGTVPFRFLLPQLLFGQIVLGPQWGVLQLLFGQIVLGPQWGEQI